MNQLLLAVMAASICLTQCGCKRKPERDPMSDPRIEQVQSLYQELWTQATDLQDEETGWLNGDCDAMLWEGRRRAADPTESDALLTAEYPDDAGRFARRPISQPCWTKDAGDLGAQTTWSRDMAIGGLLPWAWLHKRLDVISRHAAYGRDHVIVKGFPVWQMGEPLSDAVIYTPALIGAVAQVQFALGGTDSADRKWSNIYSAGLTDYEANLQVSDIWLRGEVSHAIEDETPDQAGADGSISKMMYDRLVEHARQEPGDPFYAAVLGKYSGDMGPAIDALFAGTVGGFVRCARQERCTLSERLFAARIILRAFGRG